MSENMFIFARILKENTEFSADSFNNVQNNKNQTINL